MGDLKYIIFTVAHIGQIAVVFNGLISHIDMCPMGCNPVSAGFCSLSLNKMTMKIGVKVWGKSTSLGLDSHEGDGETIIRTLSRSVKFYKDANF